MVSVGSTWLLSPVVCAGSNWPWSWTSTVRSCSAWLAPARSTFTSRTAALPYPFQASRAVMESAPAIGGVAVGREQQRQVVVDLAVLHHELDDHLGVERFPPGGLEPGAGLEHEPVAPRRHATGQPVADSAVLARGGRREPHAGVRPRALQPELESRGGLPEAGVEHVGRDPGHGSRAPISAPSRSWVIFRCSSAATSRSRTGSFPSRASTSASSSWALRPAAQTM